VLESIRHFRTVLKWRTASAGRSDAVCTHVGTRPRQRLV